MCNNFLARYEILNAALSLWCYKKYYSKIKFTLNSSINFLFPQK